MDRANVDVVVSARAIAACVLLAACSAEDVAGAAGALSGDGLSLRVEGAWAPEARRDVERACLAWAPVLEGGCRVSPEGSVPVTRGPHNRQDLGTLGVGRAIVIGERVTPEEIFPQMVHSIAGVHAFANDLDARCAASSGSPPDKMACWSRVSALDVERCRGTGECR